MHLPLLLLLFPPTWAAPGVPARQIPGPVLVELQQLENRFELALADDCADDLCYSKGCVWLDHAVADRPRASSMPGLGDEPGPDGTIAQEYLTQAECSFAHEPGLDNAAAQALVRRLQTRLTRGWTVVTVSQQALSALPAPPVAEPPADDAAPPPEPVPEAEPEWTAAVARRQLWDALLPHFYWMTGLGLATGAAVVLIWAARRVGKATVEEQALLAELTQPPPPAPVDTPAAAEGAPSAEDAAFVAAQEAGWSSRLAAMDPTHPDPELQALVRERLRAGDLPLLAKAVLRFPEHFPALFPTDGEIATAKLELAELLQTVDVATLPDDVAFFTALQRHALAARLATQPDARVVRGLREDFGAAGLAALIAQLPPRLGALLFALTPPVEQHEMVRLLTVPQVAGMAHQLLRSNRMDPAETRALFDALRTADGASGATAAALASAEITDRGATFDAAAALAVLLPTLRPDHRAALYDDAIERTHGSLPAWTRNILTPDMLLALSGEARADLLLEVEAEPLAAWLSLADADVRAAILAGAPESLRLSVEASSVFPSRARQLALAARGRRELARGFQAQLARVGLPFEDVVRTGMAVEAG